MTKSKIENQKSKMQSRRWAVWFAVEGNLRFLSHRNMMSLCERAAARAQLPIKFSEGFNPRPKLSLPLPRPVGVASRCELLIFELARSPDDSRWPERLGKEFPSGMRLLRVEPLPERRKAQVKAVTYELSLAGAELTEVTDRLSKGDIGNRIGRISVDTGRLSFTLTASLPAGPTGPGSVLTLLGLPKATEVLARLTRTDMECEF